MPLAPLSMSAERGYKFFGINRGEKEGVPGIWYREWAPACKSLCLVGEFNDWDAKENHWGERNDFGVFTLFLPDVNGQPAIKHRTKVAAPPSPPPPLQAHRFKAGASRCQCTRRSAPLTTPPCLP